MISHRSNSISSSSASHNNQLIGADKNLQECKTGDTFWLHVGVDVTLSSNVIPTFKRYKLP